jgi:hypothetical protein
MRGNTMLLRFKAFAKRGMSLAQGGASRQLAEREERVAGLRRQLEKRDKEITELRTRLSTMDRGSGGIEAGDVVWIFCTGRSGSTWLASMLGDLPNNALWDEPLVGALFGEFYEQRGAHKRGAKFIMGPRHKDVWLRSIRSTVLEGARARYPGFAEEGYLIVKEPHGSIGAPLLAEALPESRVIFLVRDPRDILASALDAHREGSWISRVRDRKPKKPGEGGDPDTFVESDTDPDGFLRQKATKCLRDLQKAKEAYEVHRGPRVLIRYEDLRVDALNVMGHIHFELGMDVDLAELSRVVEAHAWEGIPEEEKGEGKFRRKAKPGGWREDLTPAQAKIVEGITTPVLDNFYPGWRDERNDGL